MDPEAPDGAPPSADDPSVVRWVLGFLLVGMAWGLTTPFIRKAAVSMKATPRAVLEDPATGWLKKKMLGMAYTVLDMLRNPRYSVPLLVNITGSIWFFLLIGQAELSLTVPITNSLAFMFTVLGEWWAEGTVISRDTWVGMTFVVAGIALCVNSKI